MYAFFPYKWYFAGVRCRQKPSRLKKCFVYPWGAPRLWATTTPAPRLPAGSPCNPYRPARRPYSSERANARRQMCAGDFGASYSGAPLPAHIPSLPPPATMRAGSLALPLSLCAPLRSAHKPRLQRNPARTVPCEEFPTVVRRGRSLLAAGANHAE